jgi:hypothetical protein
MVASYATAGPSSGGGLTLQFLGKPARWFAAGAMLDIASLSDQGIAAANGLPYEFAYQARFLGAAAQLRAPFWILTPYAELAMGFSSAPTSKAENVSCSYGTGFGTSTGAGLQAAITPRLSAGFRWATRMVADSGLCFLILGPHTPARDRLHTLGLAVSYSW